MTKLTYIHGIPSSEWTDRGRNVAAPTYMNYSAMTEGELRAALVYDQLKIYSEFYPENQDYRRAAAVLQDAIFTGLHGPSLPNSALSGGQAYAFARTLLERSRRLTQPAAHYMVNRPAIGKGRDDFFDPVAALELFGALASLVGHPDQVTEKQPQVGFLLPILGISLFAKKKKEPTTAELQAKYQKLLNEKLEGSSHHILYNFVANPNAESGTVAAKTLNHRLAVAKWAEITGLSEENIRQWLRNGVLRGNAKQGIAPLTPEDSIETLRVGVPQKNASASSGVGEPITIGLVIAILSAISGAVAVTAQLINSLEARDSLRFKSSLGDIGLTPFGPEETDWITGQPKKQDFLLPAAIAAGAYILLRK